MPGAERADSPQFISQGDRTYPDLLIRRLGANSPKSISVVGASKPLSAPMTAFLCSKETPGATILKAFDQAAAWRDAERCVISGFHSPLEQQCLDILLRGTQPIVKAVARAIGAPKLPPAQRRAFNDGRLTIVSPFTKGETQTTSARAFARNLFAAAMAEDIVFAHISPGGGLSRLLDQVTGWDVKVRRLQE